MSDLPDSVKNMNDLPEDKEIQSSSDEEWILPFTLFKLDKNYKLDKKL